MAEWLKAADCKSVLLRVRWFESLPVHQKAVTRNGYCSFFIFVKQNGFEKRETIRIWMYRYQNSGVKNLKTPKKYNKYTGQFKVNIVINEFKHSYNEIDKENSSLKYQLEQKDEEIDKLKGEILIKF